MTLIAKGKVKEVHEIDTKTLRFFFTDQISVFDKIIPSLIPRKGESLCRTSAHWFEIAQKNGINTHFRSLISPNEMEVLRFRRENHLKIPDDERRSCIIPLEFICRHYIAGSMWDRIQKGSVEKSTLGIEENVEFGQRIPEPFIEITTKFEKWDRPISETEAIEDFGLRQDELERIRQMILTIDKKIAEDVSKRGLIHVDGKKEFGIDEYGSLTLIDTFGTADEDRFWIQEQYDEGKIVDMSKEFVRNHYRKMGFLDTLTRARETGMDEPDIPQLPEELIKETSKLYISLFERITGKVF